MKLTEINKLNNNEKLLFEMANIYPNNSGLSAVIWIGIVGGQHSARVKVSNTKHRYDKNDNFSIAIDKHPYIIDKHKSKVDISSDELADVFDWITVNYDKLKILINAYEKGDLIYYNGKNFSAKDFLKLFNKV